MKDPGTGPKVMRHTIVPPLPGVERTSEGIMEVPEEVLTWKGSIFSVFSNKVADWEGSGYGALLQTPSVSIYGYSSSSMQPRYLQGCVMVISLFALTAVFLE